MRPAQPHELTDGAEHDYLVLYPSGTRQQLRGVFGLVGANGDTAPTIRAGEALIVLDPRAVIARDGLIIYEPRRGPAAPWVRDWLAQHPEWPRVATEMGA